MTKPTRPNLTQIAESVLVAIGAGAPESFELSTALVASVLGDDVLQRASELRRLLDERSPFAMVRAVELAESVLALNGATTLSVDEGAAKGSR